MTITNPHRRKKEAEDFCERLTAGESLSDIGSLDDSPQHSSLQIQYNGNGRGPQGGKLHKLLWAWQ